MECLENIIGISKSLCCDCLEIYNNESLSGLYLDDTNMGRLPLSAAVYDCSDTSAIDFLTRLIPNAVNEMNELLYRRMDSTLVSNFKDYNFKIPNKLSYSNLLPATTGWYFMSIKPKVVRGTKLKIKSIVIQSHTGIVKIIDEFGTELYSNTIANFTETTLTLDREYYIAYQSATRPRDIKFNCNSCSGVPQWNNYFSAGGGIVDDLDNLDHTVSENSYGIQLTAVAQCDSLAPLCDLDFVNDGWGRVYAMAVLNIARKNFAAWILSSGQITNYVTTNGEELPALIEYYMKEIDDRVKFLPTAYNLTDCYRCGYISKGDILI
jgi:hypothetical protein